MHKKFLRTLFVSGLFVLGLANSHPSIAMNSDDDLGAEMARRVARCHNCKGVGIVLVERKIWGTRKARIMNADYRLPDRFEIQKCLVKTECTYPPCPQCTGQMTPAQNNALTTYKAVQAQAKEAQQAAAFSERWDEEDLARWAKIIRECPEQHTSYNGQDKCVNYYNGTKHYDAAESHNQGRNVYVDNYDTLPCKNCVGRLTKKQYEDVKTYEYRQRPDVRIAMLKAQVEIAELEARLKAVTKK